MEKKTELTTGRWTNKALFHLIWPIMVERLLMVLMGTLDTIMVASLGEAAVGGVSLVDAINMVLIDALTALATGGAVVCSQYLGREDTKKASTAAKQLLYIIFIVSIIIMAISLGGQSGLLRLIYGNLDMETMKNAEIYFFYMALSFPFLAIFNGGNSIFRSMGNSRVGMMVLLVSNILDLVGNYVFIYIFHWGVAGAAISTLMGRALSTILIIILLLRSNGKIRIEKLFHLRFDWTIIKSILRIAIPSGAEGSMFQIGKLMLARLAATFGTIALAGNAIATIFIQVGNLPGISIGMAFLPIVGQCIGAGEKDDADRYTKKLVKANYLIMGAYNLIILLLLPLILPLFGLTEEATKIAWICSSIFCAGAIFVWTPAYCLPFALRAAGDNKYVFTISTVAMWVFRVGAAYFFAYVFHLDVYSIWIAMVCEWLVRGAGFALRWKSGKWRNMKVI